MNGWHRIGVVAFVIWALVASIEFWSDGHKPQVVLFSLDYGRCFGVDRMTDLEREQCVQAAENAFRAHSDAATKEFWQLIPFVITIPALLVWGLISLMIVTVRWITKGFA
jgi:hypothetical protein